MSGLLIHNEKIIDREAFVKSCPFGALEIQGDKVVATSACRVCGVCVKRAQNGETEIVTEEKLLDRTAWNGVAVYAERAMALLYEKAKALSGAVSGEHGIGYAKKGYLRESLDPEQLALMRGIKGVFDPNYILNPDKICF